MQVPYLQNLAHSPLPVYKRWDIMFLPWQSLLSSELSTTCHEEKGLVDDDKMLLCAQNLCLLKLVVEVWKNLYWCKKGMNITTQLSVWPEKTCFKEINWFGKNNFHTEECVKLILGNRFKSLRLQSNLSWRNHSDTVGFCMTEQVVHIMLNSGYSSVTTLHGFQQVEHCQCMLKVI